MIAVYKIWLWQVTNRDWIYDVTRFGCFQISSFMSPMDMDNYYCIIGWSYKIINYFCLKSCNHEDPTFKWPVFSLTADKLFNIRMLHLQQICEASKKIFCNNHSTNPDLMCAKIFKNLRYKFNLFGALKGSDQAEL